MFPSARFTNDSEVLNDHIDKVYAARGVVGWEDADEHHDLGTDSNDGHTLIRVTLNQGLPPEKTPEPGKAHGYQVLCQSMGPVHWIPAIGTPVIVIFPEGDITAPGAGFILGSTGKSPSNQYTKDKAKMDFGPDMHLVIKAKSITLSNYENTFVAVVDQGKGIRMGDKYGNGAAIGGSSKSVTFYTGNASGSTVGEPSESQSVFQLTNSKMKLTVKNGGFLTFDSLTGITNLGASNSVSIPSTVFLGKSAAYLTRALVGVIPSAPPSPSPVVGATNPIPFAASGSVFISVP